MVFGIWWGWGGTDGLSLAGVGLNHAPNSLGIISDSKAWGMEMSRRLL